MPSYEYECKKCREHFEVTRRFTETGGGVCPLCGGEGRRIYTAPPLIFKGSGFYTTDHRKSAPSEGGEIAQPQAKAPAPESKTTKKEPAKAEPAKK